MYEAVILIERGFQDEEFVYPYYRMKEAGWDVTLVCIEVGEVRGKYGVPARGAIPISQLVTKGHGDLLYIPGGWECPERLRMDHRILDLVRAYHRRGALIASICHGPQVLISAGIVKGRTVTGYQGIKDDLLNAGAIYPVETIARDGNLITAQHYRDNPAFMREVIDYMQTVQPKAYADSPHAI